MYSVIIQNQKTMESFSKFYPLFLEAVNDNKIGLCRWIESGTNIETAVPELFALTDDKQAWRAIIVRFYDEHSMGGFSSNPSNPFDFDISSNRFDSTWENAVPLVRLTQILGGVPAPEMSFETKIEDDFESMESRMVFTPIANLEESERHKKITENFYYNGKHPSEIVLISLRRKEHKQTDNVKNIWQNFNEIQNSEFWNRNGYPSICRFLLYDMEKQGPIIESANTFKFWTSILLFTINKVDPNALQAYKLYKINVDIDGENMKSCFQQTFNRLISAREFISESIKHNEEQVENIEDILPNYSIEVPVVLKAQKRSEKVSIIPKSFGLFANETTEEISKWRTMKNLADAKIKSMLSSAEKSLDITADKVRDHLSFEDGKSFHVDKYQVDEIKENLNEIYTRVLKLQSELPRKTSDYENNLQKIDKNIRSNIYLRMTKFKALGGYLLISLLTLMMAIPTLFIYNKEQIGSLHNITLIIAGCLCLILAFELLTLLYQRQKLRMLVREYRNNLNIFLANLHIKISSYSKYMSDIASHARGSSFLRTVQKQKLYKENIYSVKLRHIKDVNLFISHISDWSRAFYCPLEYDAAEIDSYVDIDTNTPSSRNIFYTFDYKMNYQVQLNNSGDTLDSPIDFVDKLIIEREELYDDK